MGYVHVSLLQYMCGWVFIRHSHRLIHMFLQAVPLSARKAAGGSTEGIAPFLQLPHFSEDIVQKIAREV